MALSLTFQCVRKTESLDGNQVVIELTLNPVGDTAANQTTQYNMGAAIGTPNAPQVAENNQETADTVELKAYTGGFNLTIKGTPEQTAEYGIGKKYTFELKEDVKVVKK